MEASEDIRLGVPCQPSGLKETSAYEVGGARPALFLLCSKGLCGATIGCGGILKPGDPSLVQLLLPACAGASLYPAGHCLSGFF